jgi:uncharacterized membrane protein YeaQ/YmgE (transglycosylase-associated protein family)
MTITLTGLIVLLVIAGICGAIGRAIGGGTRGGFLISIVVGFVGAVLGLLVADQMDLPELLRVNIDGHSFPILWSIIGSALLVVLTHLLTGRTTRRFRYR